MQSSKKAKKPTKKSNKNSGKLLKKVKEHKLLQGRLKFASLAALVLVVATTFWVVRSVTVNADSISWTGSQAPSVTHAPGTIPTQPYPSFPGCVATQIKLNYLSEFKDACITIGSSIALAVYNDGGFKFAVSKAPFDAFYKLYGVNFTDYASSPVLVPSTDTVYMKLSYGAQGKFLTVFNNFSTKLVERTEGDPSELGFNWNSEGFDYRLNDENGNGLNVNGLGHSPSGEWIAAEVKGQGIVRVNAASHTASIVSKHAGLYNAGSDPIMEFTVTDNGEHIALGGKNAGLNIIDVQNCGDAVTSTLLSGGSMTNPCPEKDFVDMLNGTVGADSLTWPTHLAFDNGGASLNFFYGNANESIRPFVTLTAPSITPSPTTTVSPSPTATTDPRTKNGNGPVHALEVLKGMVEGGALAVGKALEKVQQVVTNQQQ